MGFYGNITNTAKTTFSFDHIYPTRTLMDKQANLDGVFLGRYVLVNYDEEPIKAYYYKGAFYNGPSYIDALKLEPIEDVIYQDLNVNPSEGYRFYKWDPNSKTYQGLTSQTTGYAAYFSTDVSNYGRGYDSTVWVKRYNEQTSTYQYVLIAELNAVIPTLHLVVDKPMPVPVTPYFDRDTSNIDYYLHMQSEYGMQIKEGVKDYSDEQIIRRPVYWELDNSGKPVMKEGEETPIHADIFFNKKGFDFAKRTYIDSEDAYNENTINYSMAQSGKLYGNDATLGVYQQGYPADDVYEWYIHLAGIGNAISTMWDKVYDDRGNNETRALNKAAYRNDTDNHLVSYNKNTLIGMMNTAQDLLGYYFIPLGTDGHVVNNSITESRTNVTVPVIYEYDPENPLTDKDYPSYPVLSCLFYEKLENDLSKYYCYSYDPVYHPFTGESLDENTIYYYKDENNIYHLANPATYNNADANGNNTQFSTYYTRSDRWTLKPLEIQTEDSLYALIAAIHKLIGTNADEVRDFNTLKGTINIIKDIISYINLNLKPGTLLHVNDNGVIEHTDTYFPAADWNKDKILDGNGDWVSRFASVKVLNNSNNANQNAPKVNIITNGAEQNVNKTIISDNDKTNYGTSLVNNKKHTTNNLTLGTRNKWIELYGDEVDDSIEFKHSTSPVISRLRAEQATGTEYLDMYTTTDENGNVVLQDSTGYHNFSINDQSTEIKIEPTTDTLSYISGTNDQDDNRLTIPYLTIDNAGHVVELGTKNFNIPHTYKHITLTEQSNSEDFITPTHGDQEADLLTDRLTFSTGNKWIEARIDEDKITHSHKLVPNNTLSNSVSLNGNRRTNAEDIETIYRYGLPNDKSISTLDEINGNEAANTFNVPYIEVDKAGHVVAAETHIVELPDNYTTIIVGEENTSIGTGTTTGVEGETSDNFAGAATLKAESLTESITFSPSNKWIRLKGDNTKGSDTITIGHEIHNIIATTSSEDLDIVTNVTDDTRTQKATFDTQTIRWDNAGHITGYDTKTWTLPDAFHNIVINGESTEVVNATANNGTLSADTTFDSFSMAPSNKWIRLYGNSINDNITVGHLVQDISTSSLTTDLNFEDTFKTEEYTYDEAGHIRSKATRTLTLPYSYKTFKVSQNDSVNAITTNTASVIAQNQIDTMEFAAGNKWIQLAALDSQNSSDTITIAHSLQGTAGSYGTNVAFTEFGGTVDLQGYQTDNAGHIIGYPTYTLTLPKGSYKTSSGEGSANVITGMSLDDKSGEITTTYQNAGTLLLTGYTKLPSTVIPSVLETQTINKAFASLDDRIETEEEARAAAISNLRMFKTIKVNDKTLTALSNDDTIEVSAGNEAIVLNADESNNTYTITHKEYIPRANGLYKITVDEYGHVTDVVEATKTDIGLSNVENKTIEEIVEEITSRFSLTLNSPILMINISNDGATGTIDIDNKDEKSVYTYAWTREGSTDIISTNNTYTALDTEVGAYTYRCTVTRIYAGESSTAHETFTYTIEPPPVVENPEAGEGTA